MSNRSSLLGNSHRGFQQIPEDKKGGRAQGSGDATIDIPLATVPSKHSGRDMKSPLAVMNEKDRGLQAGPGKRRHTHHNRKDREDGVRTMGRIYERLLNFSIFTRYLLYLLPMGAIVSIPIIIGATAAPGAKMGDVRIVWIFAWVLTVWVALWASKLFAKILPYIFEFLCGIVSSGTRKYALVIKALEIPISLAGWALASLATFQPIMTQNPDAKTADAEGQRPPTPPWIGYVQQVLAAFLVSSLVFLAVKILIQLISISYHRMQYDLKIKESKRSVHILSVLYDASTSQFPPYCPEFAAEDYLIQATPELRSRTATGHLKTGTATPMKLLATVGRVGDQITAAFGNIAHEVTGKEVFNPTSSHSVVVEALEKKLSSEALAKRIWMSFVVEGKDALYQEDVVEMLCEHRQHDALEVFQELDKDGNGDVSLDEMIMAVCEIGRERKAIASSLHDVDQAIHILDNLLCTIAFIVCVFIFVAFLNESFVTTLATAGTALLSLSFIFSATAAEILGSCIFLFVKHPFDVGDRVDINDEEMVVERISLLYTVFKNVANHRTRQAPNSVLNNLWIDNVSRSKAMRERLQVYISFDTTLEDVQLLRKEMQNFVLDKENNRDFEPEINVEVTGINKMDQMELTVEIKHKSNWSNEAVRSARRSKFMCALVLALRKIPIYAPGGGSATLGSADQPSYSVAVRDEDAAAARKAFADAKDKKRLVPSKPAEEPSNGKFDVGASTGASTSLLTDGLLRNRGASIGPSQETDALNKLNARPPAADPVHDWQTGDDAAVARKPLAAANDPRGQDLEAVEGILRRQSTRGKRHHDRHQASAGSHSSQSSSQFSQASPPQPHYRLPATAPTIEEAAEPTVEARDLAPRPFPPASALPVPRKDSLPGRPATAGSNSAAGPRTYPAAIDSTLHDAHPGTRLPTPGAPHHPAPASAPRDVPLPPAPLNAHTSPPPPTTGPSSRAGPPASTAPRLDTAFPAPPTSRYTAARPASPGGRTTPTTLRGGAGSPPMDRASASSPHTRFPVVPRSDTTPAVRDRSASLASERGANPRGVGLGLGMHQGPGVQAPPAAARGRKNSYAVETEGRGR